MTHPIRTSSILLSAVLSAWVTAGLASAQFGPVTRHQLTERVGAPKIVDLNGDGNLHLVGLADLGIVAYPYLGDGAFGAPQMLVAEGQDILSDFTLVDLDDDGDLDACVLGRTGDNWWTGYIAFSTNNGAGAFTPPG